MSRKVTAAAGVDTHPGDADRLKRYWEHGEGAAKIAWGTPGDFDRCVALVTEHAHMDPEQAKGYCNERHHGATGMWPAQHAELIRDAKASVSLPSLVTIPNVDLVAAGTWDLSSGRQTFTRDDLASGVEATKCPAIGNPVIKLGHVDPRFDGEPAIGSVANLRLDPTGTIMRGDLAGMPGWLAGISASAFPRRSIEGSYGYRCSIGHDHPFVLTGLALLGVTAPGVGVLSNLADIAALYGVQAAAPGAERHWQFTVEEGGPALAVTEEDVRRAYYASTAAPDWWITELQMSPTQLIVADGAGKVYRVPFDIEAESIRFGDPAELASYADVAAARGSGPVVAYASAAESRHVEAANAGWMQRDGDWVYDPDGDGDNDATAEGDTDHSHWDAQGKQLKPLPPNPGNGGKGGKPMAAAASGDSSPWDASKAWAAGSKADDPAAFFRAICLGEHTSGDPKTQEHWALPYRYSPSSPPNVAALRSILSVLGGGMGGVSDLKNPDGVKQRAQSLMKSVNPDYKAAAETPPTLDGNNVSGDMNNQAMSHGVMGSAGSPMKHSHPHPAYGSQGGDATHSHEHTHTGDANHAHAHASAGKNRNGGADVDFTDEQLISLRTQLGVAADEELSPERIVAGTADLHKRATAKVTAGRGGLPPGVMVVEQEAWDNLQASVRAGEAFRTKKLHEERDDVIDAAVRSGKFSAARKPHWARLWDADPDGTREVLAGLQKNVVPVNDIGTPGGTEDDEIDREFAGLYPPGTFGKRAS